MRQDIAVSSVDFLVGFTIFILALILVVDMVPGVLVGIESDTVDYDAVAYRTATILAEDPGWPVFPAWEQCDAAHKDEIERMGLAITKESPCVLSYQKINKFFESDIFTPQDYRDKVIFGEIPYSYNISLKIGNGTPLCAGESVPDHSYGYMRRLVKVQTDSSASIECSNFLNNTPDNRTSASISVLVDYKALHDLSLPEIYRIEPRTDRITVSIDNFSESLNMTDIRDVTLKDVRLKKWDPRRGDYVDISGLVEDDAYELRDNRGITHDIRDSWNLGDISSIMMVLEPPLPFSEQPDTGLLLEFNILYEFTDSSEHRYVCVDRYLYNSGSAGFTGPSLTDGVLEVVIW